jgi:predicted Rossmann fold flavoprotein
MTKENNKLAIIGAGAAGFFAASSLANDCPNLQITIFEASTKILSKVLISGGSRCNVTNNFFDLSKLSDFYPRGHAELRGAFSRFSNEDTVEWFATRNVALKVEEDSRMFPVTDSSQTIVDCLCAVLEEQNVKLLRQTPVRSIVTVANGFELELDNNTKEYFDFVLLATGSNKAGHAMATSLGHSISECAPSLFTFKIADRRIQGLSGVSFAKAELTLELENKKSFQQTGPVLITHWGLSGPAVLKLSALAARELAASAYQANLKVKWVGDYKHTDCTDKLMQLRKSLPAKAISAHPQFGLTRRFWESLVDYAEIKADLKFADLSNKQLDRLVEILLKSDLKVSGKGEFKEEFVTCGGVNRKEIDFKSFQSKLVPNLFFAGEILDIDGITGGYNFQAAWTGGFLVAQEIKRLTLN